jgi:CspA family cold shock protein
MNNINRLTGTVKWFNNKAGFGFITVCDDGEFKDKDIFVHYSSIRVTNSQYKYLVQGEYIDFTLIEVSSDTHKYQAIDVSGVKNGPIMCESKNTNVREKRTTNYDDNNGFNRFREKREDNNGFIRVGNKRDKKL